MPVDGNAVRVLREKTGWNRTDLAKRLQISLQYLCDIEAGTRRLKRNPGLIKRIAEELNVPVTMIEHRDAVAS